MTYTPGTIVSARGREWIVQPSEADLPERALRLRPLTGTVEDEFLLDTNLEPNVTAASFPPPDPNAPGTFAQALLLRDALRLSLCAGAGPFRSFGNLTFAPRAYTQADINFIAPRVLELTYTSNSLKPWAEALGYTGDPFKFDSERRAILRAEFDARYAKLYGLDERELTYILDPSAVYGPDYPSESFRVLKEKELAEFGEYRTMRMVLEAFRKEGGVLWQDLQD